MCLAYTAYDLECAYPRMPQSNFTEAFLYTLHQERLFILTIISLEIWLKPFFIQNSLFNIYLTATLW
jgi:hypothetical protein